jgi:hypothetical protein
MENEPNLKRNEVMTYNNVLGIFFIYHKLILNTANNVTPLQKQWA